MPKTDKVRHFTHETNHSVTTLRGDVADDAITYLKPLVRRAAGGGEVVDLDPLGFVLSASVKAGCLHARVENRFVSGLPLVEMVVRPPRNDGDPAYIGVSILGMLSVIVAKGNGVMMVDGVGYIPSMLGDLERCIAWTWLADSGYSR